MQTVYRSKIYTIQVDKNANQSHTWAVHRIGQIFKAILVSKLDRSGFIAPVFLIIEVDEKSDHELLVPAFNLTIKPLFCTIIAEDIRQITRSFYTYQNRFASLGDVDSEKQKIFPGMEANDLQQPLNETA